MNYSAFEIARPNALNKARHTYQKTEYSGHLLKADFGYILQLLAMGIVKLTTGLRQCFLKFESFLVPKPDHSLPAFRSSLRTWSSTRAR